MRIAVITTSIPGREDMLAECVESVQAQTLPAAEHWIGWDLDLSERNGAIIDRLARQTDCEWIAALADDDLFLPHHLETLAAHSDDADVVYSWCEVQGRGTWSPNTNEVPSNLHIPATALYRKSVWEKCGGWDHRAKRAEDFLFWNKASGLGARFKLVREVTWIYRFHGKNKSLLSERQSFREEYGYA